MKARGKRVEKKCECGCGRIFYPRVADVKRGWGRFYSKACKARKQEKQTGQHAALQRSSGQLFDEPDQGWDAHKDIR